MSRIIPPPTTNPAGMPDEPKRPAASSPAQPAANAPHKPAPTIPRPNITPGAKPPIIPRPVIRPAHGAPAAKGPGAPAAGGNGAPAKPAAPAAKGDGQVPTAPAGGEAGPATSAAPNVAELKGRPIGRVLTKMNKVTREQIVEALDFQKRKGGALGRILIDLGYVKEADLNLALAAQRGYQLVSLEGKQITPAMIAAVPPQIAPTQKVLPIEYDPTSKNLAVRTASPENFPT